MTDIVAAAKAWVDARSVMVNSSMKDPDWRAKLDNLSNAEDALSRAVRDTHPNVVDEPVRCDREPTHPGALLADIIPATGKTKTDIASMLGLSRDSLHDILAGRRSISPHVAARLGKLFGNGAGIWLRMQYAYDGWRAENSTDLSGVPTLKWENKHA
jgi:antitoxin HigA-1